MTSAQKKSHGPLLIPCMVLIGFDYLDFFKDLRTDIERIGSKGRVILTDKFEKFS